MTERISSTGSTDDASRFGGGVPDAALGLATVEILGLPIVRAGRDDVLGALSAHLGSGHPLRIAYVNAHTATLAARDRAFHECLRAYDVLLNDGVGIAIAAALAGSPVVENLNGSDFTVPLLELFAERGLSVFLYGARPGVAEIAAQRLVQRIPRLRIAGVAHGYAPDPTGVVDEIVRCGADVVLVALGNPVQERWIATHLDASGARCAVAVGAFLDFTAGVVPRAPRWVNQIGGEWLFRLAQEPRRLAGRYLLGIPIFLWLVFRARR